MSVFNKIQKTLLKKEGLKLKDAKKIVDDFDKINDKNFSSILEGKQLDENTIYGRAQKIYKESGKNPEVKKKIINIFKSQEALKLLKQSQTRATPGTFLPWMNYCGAGTRIQENILNDVAPVNEADAICKQHDINYLNAKTKEDIREADEQMLREAGELRKKIGSRLQKGEVVGQTLITDLFFSMGAIKSKMIAEDLGILERDKFNPLPPILDEEELKKIFRPIFLKTPNIKEVMSFDLKKDFENKIGVTNIEDFDWDSIIDYFSKNKKQIRKADHIEKVIKAHNKRVRKEKLGDDKLLDAKNFKGVDKFQGIINLSEIPFINEQFKKQGRDKKGKPDPNVITAKSSNGDIISVILKDIDELGNISQERFRQGEITQQQAGIVNKFLGDLRDKIDLITINEKKLSKLTGRKSLLNIRSDLRNSITELSQSKEKVVEVAQNLEQANTKAEKLEAETRVGPGQPEPLPVGPDEGKQPDPIPDPIPPVDQQLLDNINRVQGLKKTEIIKELKKGIKNALGGNWAKDPKNQEEVAIFEKVNRALNTKGSLRLTKRDDLQKSWLELFRHERAVQKGDAQKSLAKAQGVLFNLGLREGVKDKGVVDPQGQAGQAGQAGGFQEQNINIPPPEQKIAEGQVEAKGAPPADPVLNTGTDPNLTAPRGRRPFFFHLGTDLITETPEEQQEDIDVFANFSWIPKDGNFYNESDNKIVKANRMNERIRYSGDLWRPAIPKKKVEIQVGSSLHNKLQLLLAPIVQHEQQREMIGTRATPGKIRTYPHQLYGITSEAIRNSKENRIIFPNVVDNLLV